MSDDRETAAALDANREFYRAFNQRDVAAMEALWSRDAPVACAHPAMPPIFGREQVLASLRSVLVNPNAPNIRPEQAHAIVSGDSAIVICEEHVNNAVLIATNVFVREASGWRMVHHHAGVRAPAMRAGESPPRAPDKRTLH